MSINIVKVKIVTADIDFGLGTVSQTRGGVPTTYDQVNASHLPTVAGNVQTDIDARRTNTQNDVVYAAKAGNASQAFEVLAPVTATQAATKGYTDTLVENTRATLDADKADKANVLELDNTTVYTPTQAYHPATRQYVLDTVVAIGSGDMAKAVYDTNTNGVVDDSERLGGVLAEDAMTIKGTVTDLDPISQSGIYVGTDVTNSPIAGQIAVEHFNDKTAGNNDGQRLLSFTTKKWYYRTKVAGIWDSWNALLDDGDIVNDLLGSISATAVLHAQQGYVLDQSTIHKTGNETKSGVLTFLDDPITPSKMNSTASIQSLLLEDPIAKPIIYVNNYHTGIKGGGGVIVWDANRIKSDHNGGTVFDPDVAYPTDWTNPVQLQAWFDGSANVTTGCWVRKVEDEILTSHYGAKGDGTLQSPIPIQSAMDSLTNGGFLRAVGKHLVSGKLTGNIAGLRVEGKNSSYSLRPVSSIELYSLSTDSTLFDIQIDGITFTNVLLKGKGRAIAGSSIFDTARTDNIADIDITCTDCFLMSAETILKLTGRGMWLSKCYIIDFSIGVALNWPNTLLEGVNSDQKKTTGFRAIRFENNRVHAGSAGYIFTNINTNHELIWGIEVNDNYIDTDTGLWRGSMVSANFNGNTHINNATTPFLIQAGFVVKDVTINGGVYDGMQDDGAGNTKEYTQFLSADSVENLTISGVTIKRVLDNTISFQSGKNITIGGNTFEENMIAHRVIAPRNIVNVNAAVENLTFSNNTIDVSPLAVAAVVAGDVMVGTSGTVTNYIAYGNQYNAEFKLDNVTPTANTRQTLTTQIYDGDGTAEQVIDIDYYPSMVIVNDIVGGATRLQLYGTATGTTEVELRNGSVAVKGIYNTNLVRYSLIAFR